MLNKKIIGARHTPEEPIIKSKIKYLSKIEQQQFYEEYKLLIDDGVILRCKKATGKSQDFHIYLNPKCLNQVYELIK